MSLNQLLTEISVRGIQLRKSGDEIVLSGSKKALDPSILEQLRVHKIALLGLIGKGNHNDWWAPTPMITPEMLPLVDLTAEEIKHVVSGVPGGAANVQDIYPLAPLQEGILFHHLMGEEGDPYLLVNEFGFDSRSRVDAYLEALRKVVERHDILRTSVWWEGVLEPVQVVWRNAPLRVEEIELDPAQGDIADQLYARFDPRSYRMDLRQAPWLRVFLAQDTTQERWVMLILQHHLGGDRSTMEIIFEEMQAHLHGEEAQLPAPQPFRNLVAQARLGLSQKDHESYFQELLGDVEEPTAPFGLLNVQGDGSGIEEDSLALEQALARRVREGARKLGASPASLFHLAWAQVLAQLTCREDVVFGTVVIGRTQGGSDTDRTMGLFINTLPVRVATADRVDASVRKMHAQLTRLMRHEHASLALAQRCSAVVAPTPLFSTILNYLHNPSGEPTTAMEAERKWDGVEELRGVGRTNYPVTLSVDDLGHGFVLRAQTDSLIDPKRICEMMMTATSSLLQALETTPESPLYAVEVVPAQERHQMLEAWNQDPVWFPHRCIHTLFEEQVVSAPEAIALVSEEKTLTYAELNRRANRLAHRLREFGVGAEARVAICAGRSFEMLEAILAVLKAGGVYVPIDPGYPEERLRFMLQDSAPAAVLALGDAERLRGLVDSGIPVLDLTDTMDWSNRPEANVNEDASESRSEKLAYLIYTSGSTGRPKGVMVTHGNVVRLVRNTNYVNFSSALTIAHVSNVSFDASTFEIWGALLNGGRLAVISKFDVLSPADLARQLQTLKVSTLFLTTALFNECVRSHPGIFHGIDQLLFGGEVCDRECIRLCLTDLPPRELVHVYGPTETTTFATYFPVREIEAQGCIPIGRPIANTRLYILDRKRQITPVGAIGEIYIGGAGVARGYWNRPDLTAESFFQDLYSADPASRMYRTGDLGRWLRDGTIEFVGRNDQQVKIRGFRIELGEIEALLVEQEAVRDAVVVAREEEPGEKRLVAYYTCVENKEIDAEHLRTALAARLPGYMVPAAYVRLASFPLTANGKLDRRALPAPSAGAYVATEYKAPEGATEQLLATMWAELLKAERVGRHDNFFMLGGHSLLAVTLMERMRRSGLEIDVRALFDTPTLAAMAATVASRSSGIVVPPNRIPALCETIGPEMLSLVELTQDEIGRVIASVPGGAANVQDIYPLAPLQEGIFFHHVMGGDSDPYVLAFEFGFANRARLDAYIGALREVIARHDILRTSIAWEGQPEPLQVVWREAPLHIEEIEIDAAAGTASEQLYRCFDPHRFRFDLKQAPMLRVNVARDSDGDRWVLLLLLHHLIGDHTTLDVMQEEMKACLMGEAAILPPPQPYRNLVAVARLGVSREEHEVYFRELLGDVDAPTVPFGVLDVLGDGSKNREARVKLDGQLAWRIRECARRLGVSAASAFHLAWGQVLARLTGREDVVFGTVVFGRMHAGHGSDRMIGLFINTLPMRIVSGADGVEVSLRSVHTQLARLMRHEHASLALAQRCSGVQAPTPLFSALLNYRHSPGSAATATTQAEPAWEGMDWVRSEERTNYPVTLSVDDLGVDFLLSAQVEEAGEAIRLCEYMSTALASLLAALETEPNTPLRSLDVLPDSERSLILEQSGVTSAVIQGKECLQKLFEAQVRIAPDATAVVYEDSHLSYRELNARANRLAHFLRSLGVGPDSRVGICVERSPEMIVSILAVLKAGGAFVPLDPAYPIQRLQFMLRDSAPVVLLAQANLASRFSDPDDFLTVVEVSRETDAWSEWPDCDLSGTAVGLMPEHLAYVIYTSGSTGTPKGVMVEHRGVCNLIRAQIQGFSVERDSRVLQFASFSFDACVSECMMALCRGASLHLPERGATLVGTTLRSVVERHGVTHATLTPTVLATLESDSLTSSIGTLIVAGEALPGTTAKQWSLGRQLINAYGPTEATVCATMHLCDAAETSNPPIGRPIENTHIYILDKQGRPVPIRVAGELYIGGAGVARGYLQRPELTSERFLADPFASDPKARMYRTGDLGRWCPDGTIEFLGREDEQVKVRGFRIELGEIESRLAEHPDLREVVVLAREDTPGDVRLVAYYTTEDGADPDAKELHSHLSASLPEYMVPAAYMRLGSLPLTPNGKLDRKAFYAPEGIAYVSRGYEAPQGATEHALARIWADVLKVDRVGRFDNFFMLGGHSLLAVTLMERMRRVGLEADVRTLFATPTLAELAATVGGGVASVRVPPNEIPDGCRTIQPAMLPLVSLTVEEIERVVNSVPGGAPNVKDIYPLAPLQEGILFHHLMAESGDPYLLASQYSFDTRSRVDTFVEAVRKVVRRHDVLRTAVVWEGLPEPVQAVWRDAPLYVEEIVLDASSGDPSGEFYARFDPRYYRMDVRKAPWLRIYIAYDRLAERWLLLLLLHHLAGDHTTLDVMQQEIQACLLGREEYLPPVVPFRNLVAEARLGLTRDDHEAFFRKLLGDVDSPTTPFGLIEVQGDGSGIEDASLELDEELEYRIREIARNLGVSPACLCHLAWALVVAKVSGREDVVFGTVVFGRMQGGAGADRMMGLYINTLPVRMEIGGESVAGSVKRMQHLLAQLMRHEHAPLALAQRCSGVPAPAPLFSALLNYRHIADLARDASTEAIDVWDGIEWLRGQERTNYPFTLSVDDMEPGLVLRAQTAASVDPMRVCAYMNKSLASLVEALANDPGRAIESLDVLPRQELDQLAETWSHGSMEPLSEGCAHDLFEAQVEKTPDTVAVVDGESILTYAEVNRRANRLAYHLRNLGVKPDARVAICLERGLEMVVSILAVAKAGGAYVPLDPAYPTERLLYMLNDSEPLALISVAASIAALMGCVGGLKVIDTISDAALWANQPETNPVRASEGPASEHLAYVIYTSGSTGTPKGVMVPHRGLSNLIQWHCGAFQLKAGDWSSSLAGVGFDATTWEIWPALCVGAGLQLLPGAIRDPESLIAWWEHQMLDVSFLPTPIAEFALMRGNVDLNLRTLLVGGDRLHRLPELPEFALINNYGPTETSVVATSGNIDKGDVVLHIGRPIRNTDIYVLDGNGHPTPAGVAGELYIGGAGIARGYLSRPDLTAERFVVNPYVSEGAARMYKTGDQACWLPDGKIEYLGRNDSQVKIRGFRIELGEIEARLTELQDLQDAVVLVREETPGDKRLVAYYTIRKAGMDPGSAYLRSYLSDCLPEYMVPAAYVRLESLPLTPNGKLDRKALPAPETEAFAMHAYEQPQGEVETRLAAIWAEVLNVERVGRHDNFFVLGGHSLLAITLMERMRRAGIDVDVRALFETPTLAELASTQGRDSVDVPSNLIPPGCDRITPEMLPLASLTTEEIRRIVDGIPGGAANIQDIYPLGPLQEGILFHHRMGGEGDPYLLVSQYSFDTRVRVDAYVEALRKVMARHDILRTAVWWEGLAEPVQVVMREAELPVEEVVLDPAGGDISEQLYERFDPRHFRIDLRRVPWLRVSIAEDVARNRWVMLILLHHLAGDHSTLEVMFDEVRAHLRGDGAQLPEPQPFRNLVAQARLGVSPEEHEAHFRQLLWDVEDPTAPFGLMNVQGDGREIEESHLTVSSELTLRIRRWARNLGVSAASIFHLAWAQVLTRLTGRNDVVFGTVIFGRMQGGRGTDRMMGLFINTLPVRVTTEEGVEASVRAMHEQLAGLMRHEHASLALAQRCSGVQAPTPLFSSLLNFRHTPVAPVDVEREWEGVEVLRGEERTNYPVVLSVDDLGSNLALTAQVAPPGNSTSVCQYVERTLEGLLDALENAPTRPVWTVEVLPEWERLRLSVEPNTNTGCEVDRCVHELFEAHVDIDPEAIAVVFGNECLSYGELNRRANQLAHYLQTVGVRPNVRVGLCMDRGIEMIVALVAVLKAGGAYVPLDPAYPKERLQFMLDDSAPAVLLAEKNLQGLFGGVNQSLTLLDPSDLAAWKDLPESNLDRSETGLTPDHVAYVIYTSGSTGKPKGVMVEHTNVSRLFTSTADWFGFGKGDVWTLFHSYAFDFSVWELWGALVYGGRLVVVPREIARSPEEFYGLLCRENVTFLNQTPSAFRQLVSVQAISREEHRLRCVVFGGEALEVSSLQPWYKQNSNHPTRLVNMYGITETTVHVTYRPLEQGDTEGYRPSPIGGRIPDLRTYILDAHGEPVPAGVAGELYVGGAGVARGYLNRPELTAERFVPDPFTSLPARMYRTGDLGRWLADGTMEFLGRNDQQVKIRGFRIELGEIEARLKSCAGVREAVVVANELTPGGKRLVAYYIGDAALDLEAERLRSHLSASLPEYMVPAAYVRLEAFPLTANGKLDRKMLPAPEFNAYGVGGYEPPMDGIETVLASVWAEVLNVERVGRRDNFFQLGGHSLLAVTLIEKMRLQGINIDVRRLFDAPTLAEFASSAEVTTGLVDVPENHIPPGCNAITPDMLPLVDLTQEEIDSVVGSVNGGAANVQDIYPLAPLQEGILFHHLMATDNDAYLNSRLESVKSRSQLDTYLTAIQKMVDRHDILRTAIVWEGLREPVQVVWRTVVLPVEEVQLNPAGEDAAEQLWTRFDPRHNRLDVRQAPMLRLMVAYDTAQDRWLLQWWYSHMLEDHTTLVTIEREVEAHLLGQSDKLPRPLPFRNVVAQARLGVSGEEHEAFFRRMLSDVEEPTAPFGLLNVQGDGTGLADADKELDHELARRIRERARSLAVSAASVFHLAWAMVLAKVSGQNDVVFGSVLFGRMKSGAGADHVLGMFINTLPVRVRIAERGAEESVKDTHRLLAEVMHHEHASLALAQRCSGVPAPTPLFSALLNYRHSPQGVSISSEEPASDWGEVQLLRGEERTNYPFTLSVDDLGEGFRLTAQVDASIDVKRICELMNSALASLMEALEKEPGRALGSLQVLPALEQRLVVEDWNRTRVKIPRDACVHELFEEQAEKSPDAVAVVHEDGQLSYEELNRRSNRLAHYLRSLGVKPDASVAICVERGPEMIISLLAVLKAGGAYVPLDPSYPEERLQFMLEHSAPAVLLTETGLSKRISAISQAATEIVMTSDTEAWGDQPWWNPERDEVGLTPDHVAYVIYTSGSTGTPKGVMVEHRSVCNLVLAQGRELAIEPESRVLQFASFSFDACVWESVMALCQGASLHLPEGDAPLIGNTLVRLVEERGITHATLTPAVLGGLAAQTVTDSMATLVVAGEILTEAVVAQWGPGRRLINAYGPTEATVCATMHHCDSRAEGNPPIGRPIANTQVYILDSHGEPAPVGVAGALHIGGAGVALGYLGRAELTAERFVADPYSAQSGARLYCTGDVGRWLPDGEIEYLGRNDSQVKIRGFRIELGEIEARLTAQAGVREAVVVIRQDFPGDKRLVAYYTAESPTMDPGTVQLRACLSACLPEYMVPAVYVRLDVLPLTPNGKLDRKALPVPEQKAGELGSRKPGTPVEELLAGVWEEVLKVHHLGLDENFFELGGHSLLATQVISRMRDIFDVEISVRALFERPTVAGLAKEVEKKKHHGQRVTSPPIVRTSRADSLPLSYAQQRLWFLDQLESGGSTYNVPAAVFLDGELNEEALRQSFEEIVRRHEVLRTRYESVGGEPLQIVEEAHRWELPVVDLGDPDLGDEEALRIAREEAGKGFDLSAGPLLRTTLIRLGATRHLLVATMHHIVADGWSTGILIKEIGALYEAYSDRRSSLLPELEIQYGDYAVWQRSWFQSEVLEAQMSYWREQLDGVQVLELPTDFRRPPALSGRGRSVEVRVSREVGQGLTELGRREGVTVFMVMLAAWQIVLSRYSGQQDIATGTPIANRNRLETEELIGFFVNLLVLRTTIEPKKHFLGLLKQVRDTVLAAYEHQDVPFEKLVEDLAPQRDLSRTPLFQTMLVLQNVPQEELRLGDLTLKGTSSAIETSRFETTLNLSHDIDGGLTGHLTYSTDLYEATTIEQIGRHWSRLLEEIVVNPNRSVGELPWLSEVERDAVLHESNRTQQDFQINQCVHELIERQARESPDAVAVEYEGEQLSYAELNRRGNQLGHYLRSQGVIPDGRVGICVERNLEMLIGIVGILKAGAAYVPLDPAYPPERLRYMVGDSAASVLLTQGSHKEMFAGMSSIDELQVCDLAALIDQLTDRPETDLVATEVTSRNLAYVIYTSGSTGTPKGVMVEHRSLVNYLLWADQKFYRDGQGGSPAVHSISFDGVVTTLFGPLIRGQKLRLLRPGSEIESLTDDTGTVYRLIKLTPSHLKLLNHAISAEGAVARTAILMIGGEALVPADLAFWQERFPDVHLVNHFGPTEGTVGCCAYDIAKQVDGTPSIPIGQPIANTRIYILNDDGNPVPPLVGGELFIGGAAVARGYLKRPGLTAERFVVDPFAGDDGSRMYKTGDQGRWVADGTIEYLGRMDQQVKIRGFRIELGEIEAILQRHPQVGDAVVIARAESDEEVRLVGYVVPKNGGMDPDAEELKRNLRDRLPEYMVPAAIVFLSSMPMTRNGKLDRKALPAPEYRADDGDILEPRDTTEALLAKIWTGVLRYPTIGVKDDFFLSGGDSLKAVILSVRIAETFGRNIPVKLIFEKSTIEEQARFLRQGGAAGIFTSLVPIQKRGNGIPLFCVHPVWGLAHGYIELSNLLGSEQPLFGLQSYGFEEGQTLFRTIPEMASYYLGEIREVQKEGPYQLIGWSMGALVAYEMAQQLIAAGEEVSLLGLLDGRPTTLDSEVVTAVNWDDLVTKTEREKIIEWAKLELGLQEEELQQLTDEERLTAYLEGLKASGKMPEDISIDRFARFVRVGTTNLLAARAYEPRPYPGQLILLRTPSSGEDDNSYGWADLSRGGVKVFEISGTHNEFLSVPTVQSIAVTLRRYLDSMPSHDISDDQSVMKTALA